MSRSFATCPPNCGVGLTVNTTFDATSGAGDATPGNGVCETAPGNGVCTLRAAIEEANAYSSAHGGVTDGIGFDISTSDPNYNGIFWTINLSTALPNLSTNLDISGPGADKLTVKPDTSLNFRLFNVTTTGTVTFSGMTITKATPSGGDGGAIFNGGGGTVNLSNCIISASSGKHGGGISNGSFTGLGTVNLTHCTLSGNSAWGGGGGGIDNGGTANLTNCTISGNSAPINGGGIRNGGTLNLTNSTISGNFALGTHNNGGGISNENSARANVTNCTISGNSAGDLGGGIYSSSINTNVKSSIIALNTAGTSGPDVDGPFVGQGFNLIGKNDGATASFPAGNPNMNNDIVGTSGAPIDPQLNPGGLQNNGGPTLTIALLAGSPAIDKGTSVGSTGALTSDQRGPGYLRAVDNPSVANAAGSDGTDVGAFEFGVTIRLISITRDGSDIVVTFQGIQGAAYRLERKLNMTASTWQSISGVNDLTPSSNGPAQITDLGAVSLGKAFYRVRLL